MNLSLLTGITGNFTTCRHFDMKTRKRISAIIFCLYLAAVCILCFMKGENLPQVEEFIFGIPTDKVVHFLMFLPYPVLASLSFIQKENSFLSNLAILIILTIVGSGLAYGIEVIQSKTGYRSYDMNDFHADCLGMAIGFVSALAVIINQKLKK